LDGTCHQDRAYTCTCTAPETVPSHETAPSQRLHLTRCLLQIVSIPTQSASTVQTESYSHSTPESCQAYRSLYIAPLPPPNIGTVIDPLKSKRRQYHPHQSKVYRLKIKDDDDEDNGGIYGSLLSGPVPPTGTVNALTPKPPPRFRPRCLLPSLVFAKLMPSGPVLQNVANGCIDLSFEVYDPGLTNRNTTR
jgi:hypothetical protein